mmetsp:Transcript_19865/g.42340  ORF Transcript_19865/g.42340 Transcript_19865/m.42340 type:complete len:82 (+) Transcript_19865:417-662(+)
MPQFVLCELPHPGTRQLGRSVIVTQADGRCSGEARYVPCRTRYGGCSNILTSVRKPDQTLQPPMRQNQLMVGAYNFDVTNA